MPFEKFERPPTPSPDWREEEKEELFHRFSPETSRKYSDTFEGLRSRMESLKSPWLEERDLTLLAIPSKMGISGEAHPFTGLIGINESLLLGGKELSRVSLAILLHERTHLHVGSELRGNSLLAFHRDIDTFFHHQIIPDWLRRKVNFEYDKEYLLYKGWGVFTLDGQVQAILTLKKPARQLTIILRF